MEIKQRFTKEIGLQNRSKTRPQEDSLWRQEYRADVYWGQVSEAVWMLRSHSIIEAMWGFPGGSDGKESGCSARDLGLILGPKDPLEKEMATHCSILVWRIPWTEESGGLQSIGSHIVRQDWSDLARTHACTLFINKTMRFEHFNLANSWFRRRAYSEWFF